MIVEKLKYTIWAADSERAAEFYIKTFGASVSNKNPHITELEIASGYIAIHGGGEGKKSGKGFSPWGKPNRKNVKKK